MNSRLSLRILNFSLLAQLATILNALAWPAAVDAESFVYISVAGEQRIAIYARDEETGHLTYRDSAALDGEPGALTSARDNTLLFASLRSTGNLTCFRIDPHAGRLSQLNEVPAGADPAYVAVDNSGRYLLTAYYRAAKVMVHRIAPDGSIITPPVQELATADKAHAIVTDRSNRFAFVPHTGPNVIFQFRFDEETGQLTPGIVARVQRPADTGPRHLWFHPTADFAYVSDEQGSSISVYRFSPDRGDLTHIQTQSTLPESFVARNSTAHLEVHPSGRFLYVANRGHDSLAAFEIDSTTGRVTALGHTPTEPTPRSFHCSPDGRHLYAAGQSSGKLAVFEVDRSTGALRQLETYPVGERPWWVLTLELEE